MRRRVVRDSPNRSVSASVVPVRAVSAALSRHSSRLPPHSQRREILNDLLRGALLIAKHCLQRYVTCRPHS